MQEARLNSIFDYAFSRPHRERPSSALADHPGLDGDNRLRHRVHTRFRGRGRKAVPHSLAFHGAHTPLRIANRLAYKFESPKRGQIVVFTAPPSASKCGSSDGGATFVKRLIGLPGETVSEHDGSVLINGAPLTEPYVDPALRDHQTGSWPRIAPNHYFFLGDDRTNSCDSRIWGTVARSRLIGPAIITYWPPSRWTSH
jgi:signal peptidase I